MARIYVSSTYLDLQEHRAQVEKVIRRMGHTDVAMEYYVAEDTRPVKKCIDDVASCDIYVGIYAWRYGWQPTDDNPDKLSVTEMEFRQAERFGKPCFIFLLSDDAPWPRKQMDKDVSKIENLRNTASAKHTADWFATPDELARKVAEAIYKQIPAAVSIPEYNLGTYYDALRKRYNILALEGLTPPQKDEYLKIQLSSVFVEQSVREDTPPVELPKEVWEKLSREQEIHDEDLPSGITLDDVRKARESYYQKPSRLVLDALTDSRCQYSIILGDPGSGKSTLARYVMLSLIDPLLAGDKIQKAFEGYLPLLIELRTFAGLCDDGKCETPLEFLEHLGKTEGWGLTQSALHNHLKGDGRAVVIFDGLDEIFEPKMREMITNQIVGFTNMYPKARVIVTSRILGYRRKILSDAGFIHFTLQDLDEEQVKAFITKWYELAMSERPDEAKERSERILKSFADSASIRQLAGNPMLLTIMAIIGKHQELPRERWKLYDHAASVLIQHWDVNKHLKDERIEADFIGEDDKKELLRRLAFRMQSGDGGLAGNYVHREGLQDEFENYLKERYSQTPDRAKVIAEAMIQQFRERNFILSLYGANVFGFVHRAFLEYFCAAAFVWKFEKTKIITIEQLKNDIYGKHNKDSSWREVLRLICGMINERFAAVLAEYLLSLKEKELAADCLREIRNYKLVLEPIKSVLEVFLIEIEKVDRDARRGLLTDEEVFSTELDLYAKSSEYLLGWSEQLWILEWLDKIVSKGVYNPLGMGLFVGAVGARTPQVHKRLIEYIENGEDTVCAMASAALAIGIRNEPSAKRTLCSLSTNSNKEIVRMSSLYALSAFFNSDPQAFDILVDGSKNDESDHIRSLAVELIGLYFFYKEKTLSFLYSRALNDKADNVRSSAIRAIGKNHSKDPHALTLLRERAVNDKSPKPDEERGFWRNSVRESAIDAIAERWSDHPDTLPLLRERAENDPTPWLRERCKELIKEIEGKKE